jgi:hypothetical protein
MRGSQVAAAFVVQHAGAGNAMGQRSGQLWLDSLVGSWEEDILVRVLLVNLPINQKLHVRFLLVGCCS